MSPYILLLILCAVSAALLAQCFFSRWWSNLGTYICLVWLAAALPIMYFADMSRNHILLFYLVSGAVGLAYHLGGEKK